MTDIEQIVASLGAELTAELMAEPDAARHTIVIETTRRRPDEPAEILVGIETVDAVGQARRRFGRLTDDEPTAETYAVAVRIAALDDPAERHNADVLAALENRARDVLRRDRRTP